MKKIINILPIKLQRCTLKLLSYEDLHWYIDKIKQPFFNEFMDGKSTDKPESVLIAKLTGLITSWKLGLPGKYEVRTVIEINGTLAGGLTIFSTEKNGMYDIGYWVIPEYQGQGIAYEVLKEITEVLSKNIKGINTLRLIIRLDNYKSIQLAKKVGYNYVTSYRGREKENLIFQYNTNKNN